MAIKKKTVKSKKSAVKKSAMKKTAMKKAPVKKAGGRGRPKAAAKKAPAKKAVMKKAVAKKPVKKTVKKKVTKRVVKANPAAERIKALKAELTAVKAELKESIKRGNGLAKLIDNMEKSVAGLVKKEMAALEKLLKRKPKKRKVKKAK